MSQIRVFFGQKSIYEFAYIFRAQLPLSQNANDLFQSEALLDLQILDDLKELVQLLRHEMQ
jgi:hypothetical protein